MNEQRPITRRVFLNGYLLQAAAKEVFSKGRRRKPRVFLQKAPMLVVAAGRNKQPVSFVMNSVW